MIVGLPEKSMPYLNAVKRIAIIFSFYALDCMDIRMPARKRRKLDPQVLFTQALLDQQVNRVQELLSENNGININSCIKIRNYDKNCWCTSIFFAAMQGDERMAQVLIEHGADVNKLSDHFFRTPLTVCIAKPYKESCYECKALVSLLLQAGANVNASDEYGQTPLHHAAFVAQSSDFQGMILSRMLLEHHADPNIVDNSFLGPIYFAVSFDRPKLTATLLEFGASLYRAGIHGRNAMDALWPGWESKTYVDEIKSIYDWVDSDNR